MINLIDVNDNFNKNKNFIIDVFINYYRSDYSDIIKRRLDNVLFDFSSTPEEDYKFMVEHDNQITDLSKLLIKLRYKNYEKIQKNLNN